MSPTKPGPLLLFGLAAGAVLYVTEVALVRWGEPAFTPPISLALALVLLGVIVPGLAWPIRQMVKAREGAASRAVNPFYAMRVVLLAKAGSLTGALLAGAATGIAVFFATRLVLVWDFVLLSLAAVLGGALLTIGSLLAERWCQTPPSPPQDPSAESEPA